VRPAVHNGGMEEPDEARYGVFLTPDAKTSAAVTTITSFVQAQFGLVSARRFPPHVTLAGNLPLAVGESELFAVVGSVAAVHRTFQVHNSGIDRLGESVVFNVHNELDGTPNTALVDLAADLTRDLRPLLRTTDGLPADLCGRDSWRGHLSLASHELSDRVDLREEVELFIRQLETPFPSGFEAATVTVYRLYRSDWSGSWWTDFEWEHGRSFSLAR
jgi:2'-5' RNA ligase superfamily